MSDQEHIVPASTATLGAPAQDDGLTEMERAQRDFSHGLVDALRTVCVALVRARIVTAAELRQDFTARADAIRTDGGSDIRTIPAQVLADVMAQLTPSSAAAPDPSEIQGARDLVDGMLGLFDIANSFADLLIRKNIVSPERLRDLLVEWAIEGEKRNGKKRGALPRMLASHVGRLATPTGGTKGETAPSGVVTLAQARVRMARRDPTAGGSGDAA